MRNRPRDKCFRRPNCSTRFISGFSRGRLAFTYITSRGTAGTNVGKRYLRLFDRPPPASLFIVLTPRADHRRRIGRDKAIVIAFAKESFVTPARVRARSTGVRNGALLFAHEFLAGVNAASLCPRGFDFNDRHAHPFDNDYCDQKHCADAFTPRQNRQEGC